MVSPFLTANPYAVAAIAHASESRTIVAAEDIVDLQGVKLWARDQSVSGSLQQRLLERKLRKPLESCLRAVDGVTAATLLTASRELFDSPHPLAACLNHHRAALEHEIARLPLHPVVQLLLTAAQESATGMFAHSIGCMTLAGAMSASRGDDPYRMRLALLGGLLHDLGEMYIHPQYLDPQRTLDAQGFRQVTVHPRIGRLLLTDLTDYPAVVALAIDEHHERLDGTGYPARRTGPDLSELGRLLAVVEATLGIVASPARLPLTRALLGLQLVSSEFDQRWNDVIRRAQAQTEGEAVTLMQTSEVRAMLVAVGACFARAATAADALTSDATGANVQDIARHAAQRIGMLRKAWTETGLWALVDEDDGVQLTGDVEMLGGEMRFRLKSIQRDVVLRGSDLSDADNERLGPLRDALGL